MSWWGYFFGSRPSAVNAKSLEGNKLLREVYPNNGLSRNNSNNAAEGATDPTPLRPNNNRPKNNRPSNMNRRPNTTPTEDEVYANLNYYNKKPNLNNGDPRPATGGSRRGRGTFARSGRAKRSTKRRRNGTRSGSRR